jgi:hypothetical protein
MGYLANSYVFDVGPEKTKLQQCEQAVTSDCWVFGPKGFINVFAQYITGLPHQSSSISF